MGVLNEYPGGIFNVVDQIGFGNADELSLIKGGFEKEPHSIGETGMWLANKSMSATIDVHVVYRRSFEVSQRPVFVKDHIDGAVVARHDLSSWFGKERF